MPDKITNKNADIILFLLKKGLGVFRKDLYLLRKLQDLFFLQFLQLGRDTISHSPFTCTLLCPLPVFTTRICAEMRSVISATCEITPILRPCICNRSSASIAMRNVSGSREPNPSSIKRDSTFIRLDEKEERPSANANDTKRLSA